MMVETIWPGDAVKFWTLVPEEKETVVVASSDKEAELDMAAENIFVVAENSKAKWKKEGPGWKVIYRFDILMYI